MAEAPPPSSNRRSWFTGAVLLAAGLGAGGWVVLHWGLEETDNAQLQAPITEISSRIPGTISRVAVEDNQLVKAGDLLVALDDRDAKSRLRQAQADLLEAQRQAEAGQAQANASVSQARAAGSQADADQQAAKAEAVRSKAELVRLEFLLRQGGVSRQEVERARSTYQQALSQLTHSQASRAQSQASRSQVNADQKKVAAALARIDQIRAALAQAQLQLAYTRITAPQAGRIGSRSAEPGRQLQPGQPLMLLVAAQPWVEANFKETQLASLYSGQPAEIRIDALPGQLFHGQVRSLAPASGARFALLPPDNATGNFTKVVQRITARISFDELSPELAKRLVPGLSANVRVRRR